MYADPTFKVCGIIILAPSALDDNNFYSSFPPSFIPSPATSESNHFSTSPTREKEGNCNNISNVREQLPSPYFLHNQHTRMLDIYAFLASNSSSRRRKLHSYSEGFSSLNPAMASDWFSFKSLDSLKAFLSPRTTNKFDRVSSDSAPPCNQSTLDKEVP